MIAGCSAEPGVNVEEPPREVQAFTPETECLALGSDQCRLRLLAELADQGMHITHGVKWTAWFSPNVGAFGPGRPGKGATVSTRMNNEAARVFMAIEYDDVYVAALLTQWSFTRPGYVVVLDEEALNHDYTGDALPP
jgi:hypothetical protein